MKLELGELKKVNVRECWPDEAAIFTPWLAKEENIALLGKTLGMEMEVEGTEVAVGPYSADILARDLASGDYIVIENQLEKTDHDHLGKAITYAAVLDAAAIVWIASNFTEEHKKAIDWLNDNSSEDVSYFGIHLEVWQIDESKPAVNFNLISWPADFARRSVVRAPATLSDARKLQLEWWQAVRTALLERQVVPSAQKASARSAYDVALGRTGYILSCTANTYDNKLGVRMYMVNRYNAAVGLAQLLEQKDEIEAEVGEQLIWDASPDAMDKIIALYYDADLNKRAKWPDYLDWMVDRIAKFREVFSPRVKALNLDVTLEDELED